MIKFHELKAGDIVLAQYEGQRYEGEVTGLNSGDHMVSVQTTVQEFWYAPDQLFPVTLDEEQMEKFGFEKETMPDNSIKYKKGPFRVLLSEKGNFSHFEMWYREDRRHITHAIFVHELQNHYRQMTKVELVRVAQTH